jgi:hypothetical protein
MLDRKDRSCYNHGEVLGFIGVKRILRVKVRVYVK